MHVCMEGLHIDYKPAQPLVDGVEYHHAFCRRDEAVSIFNGLIEATQSHARLLESHLKWLAPIVAVHFVAGVVPAFLSLGLLLDRGPNEVAGVLGLAAVVNAPLAWFANRLGVRSQGQIDALKARITTLEKCRDSIASGVPFGLSVTKG